MNNDMMINRRRKWIQLSIDLLLFMSFIVLDRITKSLAVLHLKNQKPFVLIDQVLELHYLENNGAAFGMLQNQKALFVLIAVLVLISILYVLIKMPVSKKYRFFHLSLILIAAGAVGNSIIDRIRFDYVIDFIYFKIINFPIFNVADIFVCIGTAILAILVLFVYKEEDLDFLSFHKKSIRQMKE